MSLSDLSKLQELIKQNKNFVLLSGAGVSTASGVPDFRSEHGLYKKFKNAEYLLSHEALVNEPSAFFDFYKKQMLLKNIKPNLIHQKIAAWEAKEQIGWVITQNIDGLHSLAGNEKVIELHGTIYRNYCMNCHKTYSLDFVKKANNIPKCLCGGIVRPDVILYGEMLHPGVYEKCYEVLQKTNLLLVAGTGLTVSTAANIINMFKGKHLVIINNQSTPYDYLAELVIHQDLTEVFLQLT